MTSNKGHKFDFSYNESSPNLEIEMKYLFSMHPSDYQLYHFKPLCETIKNDILSEKIAFSFMEIGFSRRNKVDYGQLIC